jgi:hypothetical protein
MRKIDFDPPKTLQPGDQEWWNDWSVRARKAIEKQIAGWEAWTMARQAEATAPPPPGTKAAPKKPPRFNEDLWTEFKDRLLKSVFGNKCAYCESSKPARWPVHVEHFRPKGAVEYRKEGDETLYPAKTIDPDGKEIDHPGYFWLAYNWRNLLPSCSHCNTGNGKNAQFPISEGKPYVFLRKVTPADGDMYARAFPSPTWKGMYYLAPEDLNDVEDPLLLNPCVQKPSEHIRFGVGGVATGLTPQGKHSMDVFDLRDEDLRQERQEAQESGLTKYLILMVGYKTQGKPFDKARELALKNLDDERASMEYSAAVLDTLPAYWNTLAPAI